MSLHPRHLPRTLLRWTPVLCLFGLAHLRAENLSVAAATNLTCALTALDDAYLRAHPADTLAITVASPDALAARIEKGAPIDVFLSSDTDTPQKLVAAGAAVGDTFITFATGRLALWTTVPDLDVSDVATILDDPRVKHVALPDPSSEPYGRAARDSLRELEIWDKIQPKILVSGTLEQTEEAVATGRAEAGFVALALLGSPRHVSRGICHTVPPELYDPLDQGAVVTRHGAANPAARRYLSFLKSRAARDVLRRFGFDCSVL
jgi:molybdate transport system substrate-binding protein